MRKTPNGYDGSTPSGYGGTTPSGYGGTGEKNTDSFEIDE